jgi:hypothetical protein
VIRTAPGTIHVEGREFFYIQTENGEEFRQLLNEILSSCPEVPLPKSGGVIEEKARLDLGDGSTLLAISYKGDLAGWRQKLTTFCRYRDRTYGIASNQNLVLSDGREINLLESKVSFEK